MRNMKKTAELCKGLPAHYDLEMREIDELIDLATDKSGDMPIMADLDGIYRAIVTAFQYGFVLGNRATISRKLKRL